MIETVIIFENYTRTNIFGNFGNLKIIIYNLETDILNVKCFLD
jgi:hypothetical protein